MENINLKIAEVDAALTYYLQQLPIGVAYYILKNKTKQFETLYYNQARIEQESVQKQEQSNQHKEEN